MENIKKFSDNSIKKNDEVLQEQLKNEFRVYNKKVKMEYKNPLWSIIRLDNNKEVCKTWKIGKEMEIYLIESIVNPNGGSWTKFLNACLEKIKKDEDFKKNSVIKVPKI